MQLFRSRTLRFALALLFAITLVVGAVAFPTNENRVAEAAGSTTFGNLNTTPGWYYTLYTSQYMASGFTVPAGPDQTVSSVKVTLDVNTGGDLTLKFFDDNGGLPGSEIAALDTVSLTPSGQQTVTFTPNSTLNLVGGSTYYFVIEPDGTFNGRWYDGSSAPTGGGFAPTSPPNFITHNQGSSWNAGSTHLDFEISFNDAPPPSPPSVPVADVAIPAFDPNDDRLNQAPGNEGEPVAIYQGSVDVYGIDPMTSQGVLEVRVTDEEIEAAGIPSADEWSILLASAENRATGMPIEVYRLATGEFQVNTYYYTGKSYIFRWHPDRPTEGVHIEW